MSEKAFFDTAEAFPADVAFLVRRRNERVVVVHFAVAFLAPYRGLVRNFRVDGFDHIQPSLSKS